LLAAGNTAALLSAAGLGDAATHPATDFTTPDGLAADPLPPKGAEMLMGGSL
jgi:hypothetical protein